MGELYGSQLTDKRFLEKHTLERGSLQRGKSDRHQETLWHKENFTDTTRRENDIYLDWWQFLCLRAGTRHYAARPVPQSEGEGSCGAGTKPRAAEEPWHGDGHQGGLAGQGRPSRDGDPGHGAYQEARALSPHRSSPLMSIFPSHVHQSRPETPQVSGHISRWCLSGGC